MGKNILGHFTKENVHVSSRLIIICPKLLTIIKMQIKTTTEYYHIATRIARIKTVTSSSTVKTQRNWISETLLVGM